MMFFAALVFVGFVVGVASVLFLIDIRRGNSSLSACEISMFEAGRADAATRSEPRSMLLDDAVYRAGMYQGGLDREAKAGRVYARVRPQQEQLN